MCLNFEAYFWNASFFFFRDSWPLCIMQICSEIFVFNYFLYCGLFPFDQSVLICLWVWTSKLILKCSLVSFLLFSWQLTSVYNADMQRNMNVLNGFWYLWIVSVLLVCINLFMFLNFEAYFRVLAFLCVLFSFFHDSWPVCIMQICSEISDLNDFWSLWIISVLSVWIKPLMCSNFEAYFRMLASSFFH